MLIVDSIQQPTSRTTAQALESILRNAPPEEMDVAAAYVTGSGMRYLLNVIRDSLGDALPAMRQRWVTSFDYCRTEPIALETLLSLANSSVRIFDAEFCISRGCTPRVPFHPKTFFLRKQRFDYMLAGSGNISRSGLSRGYEAGLSVGIDRHAVGIERSAIQSVNLSRSWFASVWDESVPLTDEMLARYTKHLESVDKRKSPASTEDDIASDHNTRGSLKSADLQRLRVCRHFWIEAGKVTRNRGPRLPGNQLMMKRLSRVFFGFSPTAVPENSSIGTVELSFGGAAFDTFSLTYSDNKMDKLVLPIPGQEGPNEYDNRVLLFKNTTPGRFEIRIGTQNDVRNWVSESKRIESYYKMQSGRQWGVF